MRYPVLLQHLPRASLVALVVNLQAQLLLRPGDPPGIMTATLLGGPVGYSALHSSSPTPDDAGNFTAQVDSAVTVGNGFGLNTLTFWYRVTNHPQPGGGLPLIQLGIPMPEAVDVIVDQANGSGNLTASAMNVGSAVSFFWSTSPIFSGQASAWQVVETSFTSYTLSTVSVIASTSEGVAALVPVASTISEPGDFNHDDSVDRTDLRLLMTAIQQGSSDTQYDTNEDGKVDAADARWFVVNLML